MCLYVMFVFIYDVWKGNGQSSAMKTCEFSQSPLEKAALCAGGGLCQGRSLYLVLFFLSALVSA